MLPDTVRSAASFPARAHNPMCQIEIRGETTMLRKLCLATAILMVAVSPIANAQTISGDLVVNVYDASGAVVTAANLVLTEVATKLKQESATDSLGNALFPQLKPGLYQLSVSAP